MKEENETAQNRKDEGTETEGYINDRRTKIKKDREAGTA
jgi:hypothetical protein